MEKVYNLGEGKAFPTMIHNSDVTKKKKKQKDNQFKYIKKYLKRTLWGSSRHGAVVNASD